MSVDMNIKVKISPTISNEYVTRDLRGYPTKIGVCWTDEKTAREMLADAEFYSHPDGPDLVSYSLKRAYASLVEQLKPQL